jgi:hypothetical protein
VSVAGVALIAAVAASGCSQAIDAYDGSPLPNSEVATVLGDGFPHLHAVDGRTITPDPVVGPPDARVPAGRHTLVIDYQPCANANSCGLAAITAEVVLESRRAYGIHHAKAGCTVWDSLSAFARRRETPCRNYLWIADQASGETVWGEPPPTRVD